MVYLHLFEKDGVFQWFEKGNPLEFSATGIEEAMRLIWRYFKELDLPFRMVHCGRRYTLPERDEHGMPALFHQMVASFEQSTGIYFDEELGHQCVVEHPSEEALTLWRNLK